MQLFIACFHSFIVLSCCKIGYSESKMTVTTKTPLLEGRGHFSTMELKEATENIRNNKHNGSLIGRIDSKITHSTVEITVNANESVKIEGMLTATTSKFENSTDEDDNDSDSVHSSFNLALIPAAAVFVLMIFICFKCCKWFRKYTRGGDDKEVNYYAVILTDDDYDHVAIDTISSNTSLLKSNDNENMSCSYRDTRKGSNNHLTSSTRFVDEQAVKYDKKKPKTRESQDDFCYTNSSSPDAVLNKKEPIISYFKRNHKLSVSFSDGSKLSEYQTRASFESTKQPNNVRCSVRKSSTEQFGEPSLKSSPLKSAKVMTNNASTQTRKSFRYSLRTSKGHMSESDLNQENMCRLNMVTSLLDSQKIQDGTENEEEDEIESNIYIMQPNVSSMEETNKGGNANLADISKYPIDTTVELIENIKGTKAEKDVDSDMVDDVFVNVPKQDPVHNNDNNMKLVSKPVLETCNSANLGRKELMVTKSLAQPIKLLCRNCNANFCKDTKKHICDIDGGLLPDDIPSTQTICYECKLLKKKNETDLCKTTTSDSVVIDRTTTSQCHFTNVNDRPISSSSLESSGYAESSSEYSSGSH